MLHPSIDDIFIWFRRLGAKTEVLYQFSRAPRGFIRLYFAAATSIAVYCSMYEHGKQPDARISVLVTSYAQRAEKSGHFF